jgi:hypothetical protein
MGGLGQTTFDDHEEALKEWFISLLISTAPIWGGTLVLYISQTTAQNSEICWWGCFRSIIENGELFIYAASTLAPVIYIVTRDRTTARSFPSKYLFISIVILVALVSAIIFTTQRLGGHPFPNNILTLSMYTYAIAVVVFYFALVYNNTLLPNPPKLMRDGEESYSDRLREHRGQISGQTP